MRKYPPIAVCEKQTSEIPDRPFANLTPPVPKPIGLRVRAMATDEKSRIGLCGLAVMGQVSDLTTHDDSNAPCVTDSNLVS